ncbi:VOC family protein [Antrihabitans sp. YC3-6]|uniref:VOC family protein n=1 Tax=Antrihabitans stalagmiti TaxID=2799499 RepID=A0A934NTM3_9NOCA|nr:VOC family protein [Antrihabitans stalagmiti]MBJ8341082.1 VOC family protein [Antrihabitans stalagmiti]
MFESTKAFSGFSVNDIEAAKQFYGTTLGVEVFENGMGNLSLQLPGGTEVLVYPKDDHVPAVFTILNFEVVDIDKAVDALTASGVSFQRYDAMHQDDKGVMRGIAAGMGPDIAWFTDPAGNILSVLQTA